MYKTYLINLQGCDDNTSFTVTLTESEYELLQRVSEKSKTTSKYGCMPTMEIHKIKEGVK